MYQKPLRDVDELKQCLVEVWSDVQQIVADAAICEWRKRLRACVRAKGHHFEHLIFLRCLWSVRPIHLNIILSMAERLTLDIACLWLVW